MKVAQHQQPYMLTDAIASARIPHNRPVRARIPGVQLVGTGRTPAPYFCHIGDLDLLENLPFGEPCPDLEGLEVELTGNTRLLKQRTGWVDLIARINVNGRIDVRIEDVVPC